MVADEKARAELQRRLDEILGPEPAATLMGALPSEPVATKVTLDALEERMNLRFEQVDLRFDLFDEKMDLRFELFENRILAALHEAIGLVRSDFSTQLIAQTRTFVFATISTLIALAALGVAALRFS
ncbi:MAG: hypothetical protein ACRDKF_16130 [Actinomycetota bacterium]